MALFGFGRTKRIKGLIGYYGLADWWLSAFSEEERERIKRTFRPLGANVSDDPLTSRDVSYDSQSVVCFLSHLAGWFGKMEDRTIGFRILQKAEELANTGKFDVLDVHFLFHNKLMLCWKDKANPESLKMAAHACRQQIAIADTAARAFQANGDGLPVHGGYLYLAMIYERQKEFGQAIELYSQALHQGWGGDWQRDIERCKQKMKIA